MFIDVVVVVTIFFFGYSYSFNGLVQQHVRHIAEYNRHIANALTCFRFNVVFVIHRDFNFLFCCFIIFFITNRFLQNLLLVYTLFILERRIVCRLLLYTSYTIQMHTKLLFRTVHINAHVQRCNDDNVHGEKK